MTDTSAALEGKGCKSTGITEELARKYHDQLGSKGMAIIEFESHTRTESNDGKQKVGLRIISLEPAIDKLGEGHLRQVQRALFMNRQTATQGPTLPEPGDHEEPTVEGVIAAGQQYKPHPFLPVDASDDTPICDVCGGLETAPIHSEQDTFDDPDEDPEDDSDGDQDEDESTGEDEDTSYDDRDNDADADPDEPVQLFSGR